MAHYTNSVGKVRSRNSEGLKEAFQLTFDTL